MSSGWLFSGNRVKRIANLCYVDAITIAHGFAGLLPGPLRNLMMRRVLSRSASGVVFDRRVYVKFPWLVRIGRDTSVNRGVEFYGDYQNGNGITIGERCYIAPHARFHAAGHDLDDMTQHTGAWITVGDDVWIGAGAVLLPGVTVADGAVIAAGAVVTADVPARTLVGGVPARVLRET